MALNEMECIYGVGNARAVWEDVQTFQPGVPFKHAFHEIGSYWLQWLNVLTYEGQRDRETGINTFLSHEQLYIPFAYTIDDWCFDRSHTNEQGEYPIVFWDHELREATYRYPDFTS